MYIELDLLILLEYGLANNIYRKRRSRRPSRNRRPSRSRRSIRRIRRNIKL